MNFRYSKQNKKLDRWVVYLLVFTLFFLASFLISTVKYQFNFSNKSYSLSNESLLHLNKISTPIDIIVTFGNDSDYPQIIQQFLTDLDLLLDQLKRFSPDQKIRIFRINFDSIKHQQTDVLDQYNINERNLLIIASPSKGKEVLVRYREPSEISPYDNNQVFRSSDSLAREAIWESNFYSNWVESANGVLQPTEFRGEAKLIQSIIKLRDEKIGKKVYFSTGHGEASPDDSSTNAGFSSFKQLIEDKGLDVQSLDLSSLENIPFDAEILIICGPKGIFHEKEVNMIRQFLNYRGGKVFVLLDPVEETLASDNPAFGLRNLFKEWGLRCHDMLIHDENRDNYDIFSNSYFVRTFPKSLEHKLTQNIISNGFVIQSGKCRPIEKTQQNGYFETKELIYTASTSYAISNWSNRATPIKRNPLLDLNGPVPIFAVSELSLLGSELTNINSRAKLAVIGSSEIFNNAKLSSSTGNQALASNIVYWLTDEEEMLDVKPRTLNSYSISLSKHDFTKLTYSLSVIPISVLFMGLFMSWLRKEVP